MAPGLSWLCGIRFHYTLLQSGVTDSGLFVISAVGNENY